jgi:DNA-binding NtrC family response regulator
LARLLVVDDEAALRRLLGSILSADRHDVVTVGSVAAAHEEIRRGIFDAVVTDQRMPDGDGLSLLQSCKEVDPDLPVIMVTAFATVELAVEAIRLGAFDVVPKPFEPEQVRAVVRRACRQADLVRENDRLRGTVRRSSAAGILLGESAGMARVRELVARVAPVLVTGETGTGKEIVARGVHRASARASGPMLAVNCAAFAESLLESELFGHEKGAFTGADRARAGVFEAAHHGTLFLDEAAEMPLSLQAKLLRVLVGGEVVRVGSTTPRRVDVRVIAATNRDLTQRIRQGLFRDDLFYRLAVFPIAVPPLRDRKEDLPLLSEDILRRSAADLKVGRRALSPAAFERLRAYDFPGNVRELRNILERALILARGPEIEPDDLPDIGPRGAAQGSAGPLGRIERFFAGGQETLALRDTLRDLEREIALKALRESKGVRAEAARRLGLSRSDFAYRIRRMGIDREVFDAREAIRQNS